MYTKINNTPELIQHAEKFVLDNDRMMYMKFFTAAEEFCIKNDIIIGGKVGLDLLAGVLLTKDSFMWDLYCDNTYNMAKSLADCLYDVSDPHVSSKTVSMRTDIKHKEFTVTVHGRLFFKIFALDKYRGIELIKLMGPATRPGYLTKRPIKLISEEMQLIDIYRSLYSPLKVANWQDCLIAEDKLYNLIKETIVKKSTHEISGGDPRVEEMFGSQEKITKSFIDELLISDFIKSVNGILIGDYALNALGLEESPSRVQIISDRNMDDIVKSIEVSLGQTKKNIKDIKIKYVKYPLNIPSDFQITKHTVYLVNQEQVPIMDVFNCAQYELIPYEPGTGDYKGMFIANPFVTLRFKFIDLWVLKIILNLGTDNPEFIRKRSHNIINSVEKLRSYVHKIIKENSFDIFQLTNYAGVYTNELVAKKKLIKEVGIRFPIYYPVKAHSNLPTETGQL